MLIKLLIFVLSISLNIVLGVGKKRLIEAALLSSLTICFDREIQKSIFDYALLSGGLIKDSYKLFQFERRSSLPPPPDCELTWEEYMAAVPGKPPSLGRQPMAKESNKAFKATVAMVGWDLLVIYS